jgi:hypothetical protein
MEWQYYHGMAVLPWNGSITMEWQYNHGMAVLPWNGSITMEWQYYHGMIVNHHSKKIMTLTPGMIFTTLHFLPTL